jgi:hypothetical protein
LKLQFLLNKLKGGDPVSHCFIIGAIALVATAGSNELGVVAI